MALVVVIIVVIGLFVHQYFWYNDEYKEADCWPFCAGMTDEERRELRQELIEASCPDEMIVNRMPGPVGTENRSYYIKDGKRVEISEYDSIWVNANCEVPVQEVW